MVKQSLSRIRCLASAHYNSRAARTFMISKTILTFASHPRSLRVRLSRISKIIITSGKTTKLQF